MRGLEGNIDRPPLLHNVNEQTAGNILHQIMQLPTM